MDSRYINALVDALSPVIESLMLSALKAQRDEIDKVLSAVAVVEKKIPDVSTIESDISTLKSVEIPVLPDVSGMMGAAIAALGESIDKQMQSDREKFDDYRALISESLSKNDEKTRLFAEKLADLEKKTLDVAPIDVDVVAQKAADLLDLELPVDDLQPLIDESVKKVVGNIEIKDGKDGRDGTSIDAAEAEKMVADQVSEAFNKLVLPKNGENGRDAFDIDILPSIKTEVSYPRGTYAIHHGGLWRSHATTENMRGWECLVSGIQSLTVDQQDERCIVVRSMLSCGKAGEHKFMLPAMIYRGVCRDDGVYMRGDTVTYGGSLWHADVDCPPGKPGTKDSGWTLAAKKGRDGK